jgi:hypothetical protein
MTKRRRSQFPKVRCACGCRRKFVRSRTNRKYATVACKDRAAQRAWRLRATRAMAGQAIPAEVV